MTGAEIGSVRLEGARFSEPTAVVHLLDGPCFEAEKGEWIAAAGVYGVLGRRAAEDWDFDSADRAVFFAMTCRHRKSIGAEEIVRGSYWHNWILPTLRSGFSGVLWMAHRWTWGYGLRPLQALISMTAVIGVWGTLVYPLVGFSAGNGGHGSYADSLLLSLMTFVTLSFSRLAPAPGVGELMAGVEGLLGSALMALFLVSLAGRYIRRF
jgi:hypothetical protein